MKMDDKKPPSSGESEFANVDDDVPETREAWAEESQKNNEVREPLRTESERIDIHRHLTGLSEESQKKIIDHEEGVEENQEEDVEELRNEEKHDLNGANSSSAVPLINEGSNEEDGLEETKRLLQSAKRDVRTIPRKVSPAPHNILLQKKTKHVKRVIDLFTYSPYFQTCASFGKVRAFFALYAWVTLFVTIPLWGEGSQLTRGNHPCTSSTKFVGMFFTHPTFWNVLFSAMKFTLGAYLCLRSKNPKVRVWYSLLEHIALPGVVTYSIFFWGAFKELDSSLALGLAFNNHLVLPLVLVFETWISKTPFLIERAWQIVLYLLWQAAFVFLFDYISDGCFLIPALNPQRNVIWISYPGLFLLYLAGFFMCYTFTQFRDHVAPCGQEIFPPQSQAPMRIHCEYPAFGSLLASRSTPKGSRPINFPTYLRAAGDISRHFHRSPHNKLHPDVRTGQAWQPVQPPQ